jgi:hypothetical protein
MAADPLARSATPGALDFTAAQYAASRVSVVDFAAASAFGAAFAAASFREACS